MTKKRKSAGELMQQLSTDPSYILGRQARDEQIRQTSDRLAHDEEPILADLRASGTEVGSVWDLVNSSASYPGAIPVLLSHIQRPYHGRTREGVARALAVPEARCGWTVLIGEFQSDPDTTSQGPKFGLACALSVIGDDDVLDDVLAVLRDKRHGRCRIPLLAVLARSKNPIAKAALAESEQDDELAAEARRLLKLKRRSG